MIKYNLKCPYCHAKVGFTNAFQSKSNEEYFCQSCGNFSQLKISSKIKNLAKILAVVVGIVVTVFSFFIRFYLWGTFLIILLFLAFYLQIPRFMVLKKKNNE